VCVGHLVGLTAGGKDPPNVKWESQAECFDPIQSKNQRYAGHILFVNVRWLAGLVWCKAFQKGCEIRMKLCEIDSVVKPLTAFQSPNSLLLPNLVPLKLVAAADDHTRSTVNHNSRQFKTSGQVSPPKDAQYFARCASTADPTTTSATLRLQTSARKYKHWPRPRQLLSCHPNRDEDRLRAVPNNVIVLDKCLKLTMIKASCRLQYFSTSMFSSNMSWSILKSIADICKRNPALFISSIFNYSRSLLLCLNATSPH